MKGIKKLYYSISEVSEMMGLAPHVLRYWESEFEQLDPKKNRAGNRVYREEDIAILMKIRQLLKVDKYTIEGARQVLRREGSGGDGLAADTRELLALRAFLAELLQKL